MCHIQQQEGTSVVGVLQLKQSQGVTKSNHVQDDVSYQVKEMSHVNKVIEVESIS